MHPLVVDDRHVCLLKIHVPIRVVPAFDVVAFVVWVVLYLVACRDGARGVELAGGVGGGCEIPAKHALVADRPENDGRVAAVVQNHFPLLIDKEVFILRVVVHADRRPVGFAAVQHGRLEVDIETLVVALLHEAGARRVVRGAHEVHVRLLEKFHIEIVDRRLGNEALERVDEMAVGASELHELAVDEHVFLLIEGDISKTDALRVNRRGLAGRLAGDFEAIQARMLGIPCLRRRHLCPPSDLRLFQLAIGRGERDFLAFGIEQPE